MDARDLERLRRWRNRPAPDLSIAGPLEQERRRLVRQHRALGGAGAAWARVVPPALAAKSQPLRLTRGVLTVRVADASSRFALDRFLRSGGLAALARDPAAAISRVRLVL